jgi:hypothetical protein
VRPFEAAGLPDAFVALASPGVERLVGAVARRDAVMQ